MSNIRNEIINNGIVPILSEEGVKSILNAYLASILEKRSYNTRKIELGSYKAPSDLDNNINLTDYTVRIVELLINKLVYTAQLNGSQNTFNSLPKSYKDKFSYNEFLSLLKFSSDDIMNSVNNYNGNMGESFINMLISNSILLGDRIGKVNFIPYGNDVSHKKDADYRIYINTPNGKNRYDFLELFIKKCIYKGIPYEMKGEEHTGSEKDRTCLYCFDEYLDDTIQILEDIKNECLELVDSIGSPIATGLNYSYYAVCTSRQGATYNYWFNRVSSHAINYLIANIINEDINYFASLSDDDKSQIDFISNINNYSFDSEGRFNGISNPIVNNYLVVNKGIINNNDLCIRLVQALKMMCSLANFNDLDHLDSPLSLNDSFYNDMLEEYDNEKDLYLYHTEEFIDGVLNLYQLGDFSFELLIENYLERIDEVYKKFKYYALREPGFVVTDRYKEILSLFNKLYLKFDKPDTLDKIDRLVYYKEVQQGIIDYLNSNIKTM